MITYRADIGEWEHGYSYIFQAPNDEKAIGKAWDKAAVIGEDVVQILNMATNTYLPPAVSV